MYTGQPIPKRNKSAKIAHIAKNDQPRPPWSGVSIDLAALARFARLWRFAIAVFVTLLGPPLILTTLLGALGTSVAPFRCVNARHAHHPGGRRYAIVIGTLLQKVEFAKISGIPHTADHLQKRGIPDRLVPGGCEQCLRIIGSGSREQV